MQWTLNEQMKNINNHKKTLHKMMMEHGKDAKGFCCGLKLNLTLIIIDSI
jgi:homogentisate 1,2-dioxygenase